MRRTLLLLIIFIGHNVLFAQSNKEKKEYAAELAQIQNAVWGNAPTEFRQTNVPANLNKESAVVLAKSFNLSRASNGKIKFEKENGISTKATKFSILHERVKINDKSALEDFSTIEYQKKLNNSFRYGFGKVHNENNVFVGAKVIKPNGKEITVNTDEEVLTKDEAKDQESKLAISELQVGDILDYFVCKEDIVDKSIGNLYTDNDNLFYLAEEYPVLYYSIDFQFNKKIKIRTIYANGAQHFEESQNNDGDELFSLKLHNIPKYQSKVWTSPLRQYPYIEIGSAYDDDVDNVIRKNNFEGNSPMLQARKYNFTQDFNELLVPYNDLEARYKNFFGGKKNLQNIPLDSAMKALYAQWKYGTFLKYSYEENFSNMNFRTANSISGTIELCELLTDQKVDFDVLLVASRNSNTLDGVFNFDDFHAAIRINGDKPMYMFFDDIVNHFNEIPERFQGEKVIVMHPKRHNAHEYTFTEDEAVLPVSKSDENSIEEKMNISLTDKSLQKLKIERFVKEKGSLRHDDQINMLSVGNIDTELTVAAAGQWPTTRFSGMTGGKKFAVTVQTMIDNQAAENAKCFSKEIKDKFDMEPQQVTNCKIVNGGVDQAAPVFAFNETFVLDNLVKKAGPNFIIDVGKLTGGFFKLEDKERQRNVDVYMPCARSFKYSISIAIPKGYSAKGMEELAAKKSNKTGSFISSATVSGSNLIITITRVYSNNFEKKADWPQLVEIIDAASNFNTQKILLEKNG
jgi:hypothetical protein